MGQTTTKPTEGPVKKPMTPKTKPAPPDPRVKRSWWLGLDRQAFAATVQEEATRMNSPITSYARVDWVRDPYS